MSKLIRRDTCSMCGVSAQWAKAAKDLEAAMQHCLDPNAWHGEDCPMGDGPSPTDVCDCGVEEIREILTRMKVLPT